MSVTNIQKYFLSKDVSKRIFSVVILVGATFVNLLVPTDKDWIIILRTNKQKL